MTLEPILPGGTISSYLAFGGGPFYDPRASGAVTVNSNPTTPWALKNRGVFRPSALFSFDYGTPIAGIDVAGAVDTRINARVLGAVAAVDGASGSTGMAPWIGGGAGSPLNVVSAPVGSLWVRTDGGAATTLYVKESGVAATGWVAK